MLWHIFAHAGQPLTSHDLWSAWNLEPPLLIPIAASVLIYLWGVRNAWRRAGRGRGIPSRKALYFLGAILALVAALVSPLDVLAGVLFSAHMGQHLVLILIAAPLMVLSDFPLALMWALPRRWASALGRRINQAHPLSRAWHIISSPVSAWLLFTVVLWFWHAPVLYQAALLDEAVHAVEHLEFLMTAMLFWWVLLKHTRRNDLRYGIAIPYLFTAELQSGILGALMTFTSQPWYAYYAAFVANWGLTPLQDQQIAGLIMWVPGGAVFNLLTIGYFAAWLRALDQRSAQAPRPDSPPGSHEPE